MSKSANLKGLLLYEQSACCVNGAAAAHTTVVSGQHPDEIDTKTHNDIPKLRVIALQLAGRYTTVWGFSLDFSIVCGVAVPACGTPHDSLECLSSYTAALSW